MAVPLVVLVSLQHAQRSSHTVLTRGGDACRLGAIDRPVPLQVLYWRRSWRACQAWITGNVIEGPCDRWYCQYQGGAAAVSRPGNKPLLMSMQLSAWSSSHSEPISELTFISNQAAQDHGVLHFHLRHVIPFQQQQFRFGIKVVGQVRRVPAACRLPKAGAPLSLSANMSLPRKASHFPSLLKPWSASAPRAPHPRPAAPRPYRPRPQTAATCASVGMVSTPCHHV